jgi:DNA repair protein RadD
VRLILDNHQILFDAPRKMWKVLDERTSYRVEGFQFSPAWKARVWDGKEHLARHVKGTLYRAPVGVLGEVLAVAGAMDLEYDVIDNRRHPEFGEFQARWDHVRFPIRPYQEDAVEAILKDRGIETGKGLIDVATRGGKTVIILYVIHLLGVRSLILVQSERVMTQTVALARKVLKGAKIGVVGAGRWEPKDITVASVQTLTRNAKRPRCRELMTSVDFVNFDEAHHLKGKSWRAILDQCDAYYKIGTSATIFLHRKRATPMGSIVIRGVTGPVLYQITPSELIKQGWLVPPRIELIRIYGPPARGGSWDEVYDRGVVHHNIRNAAIARKALEYHDRGLTVLVNVRLLEHVEVLEGTLKDAGLSVAVIVGDTPKRERDRKVAAFVRRDVDVILGTIFKEGVDIPAIEGVVNAAGGKSKIAAVQQFRNLTPSDGKSHAVLADFMDLHNPTLAKHSLERLKVYRSHEMFEVGAE